MNEMEITSNNTSAAEQPTLTADDFMAMFADLSESGKKLVAQSILSDINK